VAGKAGSLPVYRHKKAKSLTNMDDPIRCAICRSSNTAQLLKARDHLSGDEFEVFRCRQCDGGFTVPAPENVERYYPASYRDYQPWSRRILESMYRRQTRRWSRTMGAAGLALEIGCGHGWMLNALRSHGWHVCGIERNAASARFATQELHLPVLVGDLGALQATPTFDLMIMHHVLEHLPNTQEILFQCAQRLTESGTLIIAVPNRSSWQFRASGPQWFHLDVPRHLAHFTPASLTRACEQAGLRVEKIRYVSLDQDPFGWMVSFLNLMGFPQTRWLHWLAGRDRELSLKNIAMLLLSPPLLLAGFFLAPASWIARAGACMEVHAVKAS
jgi:2-polyprenyl-3-methyl-5-hydroxy-6-metoxy-1,4-benzoquinol methylase